MGKEILENYYKGIYDRVQTEVNSINSLFLHQGVKGEGNENVLRNLLKKFIPKRYGVDTGIIIDKDGNSSKQVDIIIYDNYNYPEILGLTSVKMFPVDFVYATIEVKSKLTKIESNKSIRNIESVRKLNIVDEKFSTIDQDYIYTDYKSTPPVGFIFGYSSSTYNNTTFLNWYESSINNEFQRPGIICCLDQGLIVTSNQPDYKRFTSFLYPFIESEDKINFVKSWKGIDTISLNGKKWVHYKKKYYPYVAVGEERMLIDQSKIFLNFLLHLVEILKYKVLNPSINLRKEYLSDAMKSILINHQNTIKWRKEDYPQYL